MMTCSLCQLGPFLLAQSQIHLFPSEVIDQRILLYNKLIIAWAITKLLYIKVLKPTYII